jgi:acyl-CoA thioester hydrolase
MSLTQNLPRPLEVELTIPVRTYDINFVGIVSNIVYIRWLEDLRLKCLDEYFPLAQQIECGYAPILAGTKIDYKHPIKLADQVIERLWLGNLYQFAKRMRQIGHLVETRFIASLSKDVLQSLIELVLGRLKWTVEAEFLCNQELAATATQKGAFVSLQNGRLF